MPFVLPQKRIKDEMLKLIGHIRFAFNIITGYIISMCLEIQDAVSVCFLWTRLLGARRRSTWDGAGKPFCGLHSFGNDGCIPYAQSLCSSKGSKVDHGSRGACPRVASCLVWSVL